MASLVVIRVFVQVCFYQPQLFVKNRYNLVSRYSTSLINIVKDILFLDTSGLVVQEKSSKHPSLYFSDFLKSWFFSLRNCHPIFLYEIAIFPSMIRKHKRVIQVLIHSCHSWNSLEAKCIIWRSNLWEKVKLGSQTRYCKY